MTAMTEEEARTKHCPIMETACIASLCMARRWVPQASRQLAPHSTEAQPAHIDTVKRERGYCGLAGEPR